MAECELCGKQTVGLVKIDLEGAQLMACRDCSSLGKRVYDPTQHQSSGINYSYSRKEMDLGLNLPDDLGPRLKHAREKAGLTFKELGLKVFEKPTSIQKIEAGKSKPTDALLNKLEKALQVKLR